MRSCRRFFILCCVCLAISACSPNDGRDVYSDTGEKAEYEVEAEQEKKTSGEDVLVQSNEKETKDSDLQDIVRDTPVPKPKKKEMVRVLDYISDIRVDLKYASKDNFTGKKIYTFNEAYLRYGTVLKLRKVQKRLARENLTLLIWDAYRPVKAQYRLWEICPDARYVANPEKGYSSHSRGNTVDVTMVSLEDEIIKMPTGFDDFSAKADRDYKDCTAKERKNARKLENLMKDAGFKPYQGEWWHFSDTDSYPVEKEIR